MFGRRFRQPGAKQGPNIILLAGLSEPGANLQLALPRICEICIAKKSASGSPSFQRKFTDPGFAEKTFSNSATWAFDSARHATTDFSFSVSNRAFAASFSNSAARTRAFP